MGLQLMKGLHVVVMKTRRKFRDPTPDIYGGPLDIASFLLDNPIYRCYTVGGRKRDVVGHVLGLAQTEAVDYLHVISRSTAALRYRSKL